MGFKERQMVVVKHWKELAKEFGITECRHTGEEFIETSNGCMFLPSMKHYSGKVAIITRIDLETQNMRLRFMDNGITPTFWFSPDMIMAVKPEVKKEPTQIESPAVRLLKTIFGPTSKPKYDDKLHWSVNKEKRTIVLYNEDKKVIIKCEEGDTFDLEVGVGLALSKFFDKKCYKAMREFFRDEKRVLDHIQYAKWVLLEHCNYDYEKVQELLKSIDENYTVKVKEVKKEKQEKKLKTNDILVTVLDKGKTYSTYKSWFKAHNFETLLERYDYRVAPKNGQTYRVIAKAPHQLNKNFMLLAIEDLKTQKVYLIDEKGVEYNGN